MPRTAGCAPTSSSSVPWTSHDAVCSKLCELKNPSGNSDLADAVSADLRILVGSRLDQQLPAAGFTWQPAGSMHCRALCLVSKGHTDACRHP